MKKIAIILFNEVEVLDFAGPFEVFSVTGKRKLGEPYEVFTVAETETIIARNNLVVKPTYLFTNAPPADIFLVPGGGGYDADGKPFGSRREMNNPVMLNWVKQQHVQSELTLSVCTGALILAKAGLLDGLQATTHFMAVEALKEISPSTNVLADQRYVDSGKVILSAGVSAGIDMAFYVVAKLQGAEVALETARYMQYDYWK
ncbi:MAG: DJ-1/PfpI family protein [Cyclobacteriaceae bacterium]|nr:DJ-1/PfpI family protein [Cyclobacteriaceae bacterium]